MKILNTIYIPVVVVFLLSADTSHAHHGGATAYAIPLEGITIDGKLDDWPEDMIRYPILNNRLAYGTTDIEFADLTTSLDLSPSFMVGFSQEKDLIYLAVIVRDDSLVVGKDNISTDACEVYVDGTNCGKKFDRMSDVSADDFPAQQYLMCPPGGSYGSNFSKSADKYANPDIKGGEITRTRTVGVCTREGDITIYEWAVEVFDHYPDSTTSLVPGKTIGFDVVVVDKDTKKKTSSRNCDS